MPAPEKRLPGQSNAEYSGRRDPNADFIAWSSASGVGSARLVHRGVSALFRWFDRRREQRRG